MVTGFHCQTADGGFSALSWWSAQAVESGHSLRKRVLRGHSRHGMALERWERDSDGIERKELLTHAPTIYELHKWQWRIVYYRLMDNEVDHGEVMNLKVGALNILGLHPDADNIVWTEPMPCCRSSSNALTAKSG